MDEDKGKTRRVLLASHLASASEVFLTRMTGFSEPPAPTDETIAAAVDASAFARFSSLSASVTVPGFTSSIDETPRTSTSPSPASSPPICFASSETFT